MEKRLNKWHSFIEGESTKAEEGGKSKEQSQTIAKMTLDSVSDTNNSSSKPADDQDSSVQDVNNSCNNGSTA